jgi:hypothetical protein
MDGSHIGRNLQTSQGAGTARSFLTRRRPSTPHQTKYLWIVDKTFTHMTRLTITEDPGEEFTVRGHNTVTAQDDNEVVFYGDVTKVQVVPERESFAIQVLTPTFVLEMDFTDADKVLEALGFFETKKVLEVDFDGPSSVRIIPSIQEPTLTGTGESGIAQFPAVDFQQDPTITTFRLRGGLQGSPDVPGTASDTISLPITLVPTNTLPSWPSIWAPPTPN